VTVDVESNVFRLVHFTVEKFFEKNGNTCFPDAEKLIAETCITYLSFDTFGQGVCTEPMDWEARSKKYSLILYAATNWAVHASHAIEEVGEIAEKLFRNELKVATIFQAREVAFRRFILRVPNRIPGIHLAVECGLLLRSGADVNAKSSTGETALMRAIGNNNMSMARMLLDYGADVNVSDKRSRTTLMYAAAQDRSEGLELLLKAGKEVNERDEEGRTALMYTARWGGLPEKLQLLLNAGAKVNESDEHGFIALMYAARWCHPDELQLLLNAKANVNQSDKQGRTALMHAAKWGRSKELEMLLNAGAKVNKSDQEGRTALMYAAVQGQSRGLQLLLNAGADPISKDRTGYTCLHYAAVTKLDQLACDAIGLLLDAGADINAGDGDGNSPLLEVLKQGHAQCTKLLLDRGAKIEVKDQLGQTPLILAAGIRDYEGLDLVRLLLCKGVDVNAVDRSGQTALMMASQHPGGGEAAELMLQAKADLNAVDEERESALIKVIQKLLKTLTEGYDDSEEVGFWRHFDLHHELGWNRVAVLERLRRLSKNIVKLYLSWGVSDENRERALALVLSYPEHDKELVQMLSQTSDFRIGTNVTGIPKQEVDVSDTSSEESKTGNEDDPLEVTISIRGALNALAVSGTVVQGMRQNQRWTSSYLGPISVR
jgi:ankyrin repeat protein